MEGTVMKDSEMAESAGKLELLTTTGCIGSFRRLIFHVSAREYKLRMKRERSEPAVLKGVVVMIEEGGDIVPAIK